MTSSASSFSKPPIYGGAFLCILCACTFPASFFMPAGSAEQLAVRIAGLALLLLGLMSVAFGCFVRAANKGPIKSDPDFKPWEHTG
jgi:drug/metabolite transporter (DMT)-like permease